MEELCPGLPAEHVEPLSITTKPSFAAVVGLCRRLTAVTLAVVEPASITTRPTAAAVEESCGRLTAVGRAVVEPRSMTTRANFVVVEGPCGRRTAVARDVVEPLFITTRPTVAAMEELCRSPAIVLVEPVSITTKLSFAALEGSCLRLTALPPFAVAAGYAVTTGSAAGTRTPAPADLYVQGWRSHRSWGVMTPHFSRQRGSGDIIWE